VWQTTNSERIAEYIDTVKHICVVPLGTKPPVVAESPAMNVPATPLGEGYWAFLPAAGSMTAAIRSARTAPRAMKHAVKLGDLAKRSIRAFVAHVRPSLLAILMWQTLERVVPERWGEVADTDRGALQHFLNIAGPYLHEQTATAIHPHGADAFRVPVFPALSAEKRDQTHG